MKVTCSNIHYLHVTANKTANVLTQIDNQHLKNRVRAYRCALFPNGLLEKGQKLKAYSSMPPGAVSIKVIEASLAVQFKIKNITLAMAMLACPREDTGQRSQLCSKHIVCVTITAPNKGMHSNIQREVCPLFLNKSLCANCGA